MKKELFFFTRTRRSVKITPAYELSNLNNTIRSLDFESLCKYGNYMNDTANNGFILATSEKEALYMAINLSTEIHLEINPVDNSPNIQQVNTDEAELYEVKILSVSNMPHIGVTSLKERRVAFMNKWFKLNKSEAEGSLSNIENGNPFTIIYEPLTKVQKGLLQKEANELGIKIKLIKAPNE